MAGEGSQEQDGGLGDRLRQALGAITLGDDDRGTAKLGQRPKQSYAFWGTQPVAQFNEQPGASVSVRCLLLTRTADCSSRSTAAAAAAAAAAASLPACLVRMQAAADGPIDEPKTVDDVRKEPYGLPKE